ncbi:MAG: hypothetical protein VB852_02950 [Deltaproteobacteria bacterium]|jgi:hypothetical protein
MDAKEVKERDEGEVEATDAPLRAAAKALRAKADPRALVLGAGLQSLWKQLLPLLGVVAARTGEYPGIFKVEDGGDGRAVVHIELTDRPYEPGSPSGMERVLTLAIKLEHDHRLLGDRYYCVDCEVPAGDTKH